MCVLFKQCGELVKWDLSILILVDRVDHALYIFLGVSFAKFKQHFFQLLDWNETTVVLVKVSTKKRIIGIFQL